MIEFPRSWAKALSGLSGNISAAWFILAFVTPNFSNIKEIDSVLVLTLDLIFGSIFLYITAKFEEWLEQ